MIYDIGDIIVVNDRMQMDYKYLIDAPTGKQFAVGFDPYFSPKQMLELGIFEGKYCNDCCPELPEEWFLQAKTSEISDSKLNLFEVKSRQSLRIWRDKGWIVGPDPRGWFQWYCRYYLGRRLEKIDDHQIKRWRSFRRHVAQVKANCEPGDMWCRPRQRQALLQWSYDPYV